MGWVDFKNKNRDDFFCEILSYLPVDEKLKKLCRLLWRELTWPLRHTLQNSIITTTVCSSNSARFVSSIQKHKRKCNRKNENQAKNMSGTSSPTFSHTMYSHQSLTHYTPYTCHYEQAEEKEVKD